MSTLLWVLLDRDTELVPGRTKAELRTIATRTAAAALKGDRFDATQAETGIAERTARKANGHG